MKINNKKGFTLIELMVVIAIIGILATAGITQYSAYQARARDTVRMQDLSGFQTALATYQADTGSYPKIAGTCLSDDNLTGVAPTIKLSAALSTKIPLDPSAKNRSKPCATDGKYGYVLLAGPTGIPDSAFLLTARVENPKNANLNGSLAIAAPNYQAVNTNMSLDPKTVTGSLRTGVDAIYAKLN